MSLTGLLAETTITMRDLATLAVGDIISTEVDASEPVWMCVEGERKFRAEVGQRRGNVALRLIGGGSGPVGGSPVGGLPAGATGEKAEEPTSGD